MHHSMGYYAAMFCLMIPLEGCEVPGNDVDWNSMNYAATECGPDNEQCKANDIDMNVAGQHHSGHR